MEWLLAVVCGLMCFGFLIEAQTKISVQDPIRVALAGETLPLRFEVIVPVNQSSSQFICWHDVSKRVLYTHWFSQTINVLWELTVVNSSYSGEYHCDYKDERVYWAVLVREVGYRESQPDNVDNAVVISIVVLSVGLFLFSSIGSTILLKDYRKQHKVRDERKEEGEEEEKEEKEEMKEVKDEAATDSVYTALERGTSSIYNVLDQSDDTDRKRAEKQTQNSQKEDGIFESVYENF